MTGRRRGRGKPRILTDEVEQKLIKATEAGSPVELAAEYAGIGRSTFAGWMTKGHNESEDRAAGLPANRSMDDYVELYQAITGARARAAVSGVVLINRVARGGNVTEETTKKYRDENGQMVEETTVRRTAPDWKAAAWMLEKQHRQFFGKEAQQLEVVGAGGGAVQVEHVLTEDFAARIRENLDQALAMHAPAAIEAGGQDDDVLDADEVDETTT